jgi:hypothetical protein
MNELIVRKENGVFVLRAFRDGEMIEAVNAVNAQQILDHVRATWPVGTIVKWRIQPGSAKGEEQRAKPVRASFQLTANRSFSWLKAPPVGARL